MTKDIDLDQTNIPQITSWSVEIVPRTIVEVTEFSPQPSDGLIWGILGADECLLLARSRHWQREAPCPLLPQLRTLAPWRAIRSVTVIVQLAQVAFTGMRPFAAVGAGPAVVAPALEAVPMLEQSRPSALWG